MTWKTRRHPLNLSQRAVMMGILNATPDSFSDGGLHHGEQALAYALQMVADGAEIIDVGGESTRPGADPVTAAEEIERVVPLIATIRRRSEVLISIDTSKAEVALAAIEAGADIVNDVTGLTGPESGEAMAEVCASSAVGLVVMHMQGEPRTMQDQPSYEGGVVAAVESFMHRQLQWLLELGLDSDYLCFDPGIGFGKTLEHNLSLLRGLKQLQEGVERPMLLGVSRKSMLAALTGIDDPSARDLATSVVTAYAYQQGIALHRVHNVGANMQAARLSRALL